MKLDLDGVRMAYRRQGDGPPVVLVHSLSFDGDMWSAQSAALAETHDVIRLDMRGHGMTEWDAPDDLKLDVLADDVAKALDGLGLPRVSYAGLSLGGMVGMRFALRHPQRLNALALLNTSAEPEPDGVRAMYHQANENARGKPPSPAMASMMLALMFSDGFRNVDPDAIGPYRAKLMNRHDPEGLYQVGKAVIWRESILDALSAITVPTLVVTSDADRAIRDARGEAIANVIPNAKRLHLEGAGHMTAVERPEAITRALRELFG